MTLKDIEQKIQQNSQQIDSLISVRNQLLGYKQALEDLVPKDIKKDKKTVEK